MQKISWVALTILMTFVSFVMACVGCSEFGHSKTYQFVLGETAMFTAILYIIVSAQSSKRELEVFHTGAVGWFASGVLAFGYAIWLGK